MTEKRAIISWMYQKTFSTSHISLREVLYEAARHVLSKDNIDAEAYAERNVVKFWNWLLEAMEENAKRGITRVFETADDTLFILQYIPCNLRNNQPKKVLRRMVSIQKRPALLRWMDSLSYREYEILACVVLRELGISRITLTPSGNEGGVDFFGVVEHVERNHIFGGPTVPFRIVGQCKKYAQRVPVDKVREFCKTIEGVKNQNPAVERVVPLWFRQLSGPIIAIIVSHNGFQSGAANMARHEGIILGDSLDWAEAICRIRAMEALSADEIVLELKSKLERWEA